MTDRDALDPTHALDGWRPPSPAPLDLTLAPLVPREARAPGELSLRPVDAVPEAFDPTHALDGWRAPAPAPLDLDLRALLRPRAAPPDEAKQAWLKRRGYAVVDVEDIDLPDGLSRPAVPPPAARQAPVQDLPPDAAPGRAHDHLPPHDLSPDNRPPRAAPHMTRGHPPELTLAGPVARITLRRPQQANRLAVDDLATMQDFIAEVNANAAVRVLVLAGEGRHFCSGFDLGALGAIDAGARFGEMADALEAARPITIARLNGGVYGGAADLALACDFRLGVPAVEMFVPAARIGLHFYAGGLRRFVERLGLTTAKQVLLAGRTLDASALLGCGYLDQLLPDADALDAALQALTADLLAMGPLALLPMKQHLNAIAAGRLDPAQLAADIARARDSADLIEGQAAWTGKNGKRPAQFRGC